jgi:hypothetical protein
MASPITQTAAAGWSFTHQGQRYEYPTRDAACEALYDLQHGKPAPAAAPAAPVRVARSVCDDTCDPVRFGKELGTRYLAGDGAAQVEIYIPDIIEGFNTPIFYGLEHDLEIDTVRDALPYLVALFADARVMAALADAEARQQTA